MSDRRNPDIELLLSTVGQTELLRAIQKTIAGLKTQLDAIKGLYARISNTNNPNEILELLTNSNLDQLPALDYLIRNPDDKNWHANILLVISQELHCIGNLWEYLDGECGFADLNCQIPKLPSDDNIILDKLMSIRNREILDLIRQKISSQ
jgi:hypothetical protein